MRSKLSSALKIFAGNSLQIVIETNTIAMVLMLVFTSMGAWKYFVSSMQAQSVKQVVNITQAPSINTTVLLIAVTDQGYESFFNANSPIDRGQFKRLLEAINTNLSTDARVAIDIDLSDNGLQPIKQKQLNEFLLENPNRWVIPAIQPAGTADFERVSQWRKQLCERGVQFGLPYIPTEFGYPSLAHQYAQSLAEQLSSPDNSACIDPSADLVEVESPLQPHYLKDAVVLPFDGDLLMLAQMLQMLQPKAVFLGGTWGQQDIFNTPFGDRYGVHIHAAAYAGKLNKLSLASVSSQLVLGWVFMSLLAMMVIGFGAVIRRIATLGINNAPGSQFFVEGVMPVSIVVFIMLMLFLWIHLLSLLYAYTGYWVSTSEVCAFVLGALVFNWNFGRSTPSRFDTWADVRESLVPGALVASLRSAWLCTLALFNQKRYPHAASRVSLLFEITLSMTTAAIGLFVTVASSLFVLTLFAQDWLQ